MVNHHPKRNDHFFNDDLRGIVWVFSLPNNSRHPDYYMCSRGFIAIITGKGKTTQVMNISNYIALVTVFWWGGLGRIRQNPMIQYCCSTTRPPFCKLKFHPRNYNETTRRAPTSCEWCENHYHWPYKWVTGVITYHPYKWSYGPLFTTVFWSHPVPEKEFFPLRSPKSHRSTSVFALKLWKRLVGDGCSTKL